MEVDDGREERRRLEGEGEDRDEDGVIACGGSEERGATRHCRHSRCLRYPSPSFICATASPFLALLFILLDVLARTLAGMKESGANISRPVRPAALPLSTPKPKPLLLGPSLPLPFLLTLPPANTSRS